MHHLKLRLKVMIFAMYAHIFLQKSPLFFCEFR
jgi:hypothetical protein